LKARLTCAALLAVALLLAPAAAIAGPPEDPRIARIEQTLEPSLQAAGRPTSQHTLAEAMAEHHLQAISVAVADGGRIVWAKAWGFADTAAGVRATPETVFQAGSISKPVAASAVMQMVQDGQLKLDMAANDQLNSWRLPENDFTKSHPVTLRQLLGHTAGTTVHGFPGYAAGAPVPTVVQVLEGKPPANTASVVVQKTPGTSWNYSGGGFTIVQLMMIDGSGLSFPELMRRRVFAPLHMTSSTYEQPLPAGRHDNAVGYLLDGRPVPGRFHTYPEMAAAGLWTKPTDLIRWALALQAARDGRSAKLMSQASARQMLTPGLGSWGLGVQIEGTDGPPDELRFSHSGDDEGFNAYLAGYMTGGRAIAVMTNGNDGLPVAKELVAAIAHEYGWKGYEPRIIQPAELTGAQKAELVGSYGDGAVVVSLQGSTIDWRTGARHTELIPRGGDFFMLASSAGVVRALRDTDGRINALVDVNAFVVRRRDP
jgi:CubicO group peptidase (beta-lactamase class C family)